jgi:hypothetical protein
MLSRPRAQRQEMPTAPSVARALSAIRRYRPAPDEIDHAILSAINVTLFLAGNGNERVSEGFNQDIARSGRAFGRRLQ